MEIPNYTSVRQTALSVATAVAISVPEIVAVGSTGRAQGTKKNKFAAQRSQQYSEITIILKELNLKKQIQHSYLIPQHVQSSSFSSSAGASDEAECVNFRIELKAVISDFLAIIRNVPALCTDSTLIDNLESALTLVDYIPARSLFLMWKTLGEQMQRLRTAVNEFGQYLAVIPSLDNFTVFNKSTNSYEVNHMSDSGNHASEGSRNNLIFTQSLFNRSFVEFFQARLEMYACRLNSFADLMPNTMNSGENVDSISTINSNDQARFPLALCAMTH